MVSTELIILHTTKFSDSSVVVHTLSKEYGRRSFIVKGLASGKASMALFLPLNIVEADVVESTRTNLWQAKNFVAKCPLNGIRSDIYKNSITLFLSEVLFKTLKEDAVEEGLYEWCERSVLLLDAMERDWANFHLRFLLELAVHLGFAPEEEDLMPFAGEHFDTVSRLLKSSFTESMLVPLSGVSRNEIADSLIRYIEFHTESQVNINSLRVLRELFA